MDAWNQLGCEGWSARETQPYFEKVLEKVALEKDPPLNPLSHAFLAAAQQAGFPLISFQTNGTLREGVGIFQLNAKDGIRQSSSQAYLHPLLKTARSNLTVLTNTRVNTILLDENNTAYGVETDTTTMLATREIVLACGTFETPKLLLLSGIGPRHHLDELGISTRIELPGVGGHLIDHPEGVMIWEANQPIPEETTQYWEVGLFAKSVPVSPLPDLMFHFGIVPFDWNTVPLGYPTASLAVRSVRYIVKKHMQKADIKKRASVHTLRHTFGTHKVDKGMTLPQPQGSHGPPEAGDHLQICASGENQPQTVAGTDSVITLPEVEVHSPNNLEKYLVTACVHG